MPILTPADAVIFFQLALAMLLGMSLGLERTLAHKAAGLRTYALVSMGSALMIIISSIVLEVFPASAGIDPLRVMAAIVMGVGFISGGVIFFKDDHLSGLTTATGIWIATAIGIAVGFRLYVIAVIATALTLFVFTALWYVERSVKNLSQ
ncbi:MAG TPA: MgtC/SapB family protein [Candidatus Paceibacterota bacterium]|nr:MgtC/SapB family protein [Candidatus Paceibacterota bacterium]